MYSICTFIYNKTDVMAEGMSTRIIQYKIIPVQIQDQTNVGTNPPKEGILLPISAKAEQKNLPENCQKTKRIRNIFCLLRQSKAILTNFRNKLQLLLYLRGIQQKAAFPIKKHIKIGG